MTLGEYMAAATRQRWQAGTHDCCTFPAGWALTWGRGDPMAEWRKRYDTDARAVRFVMREGLVSLWRRGLASIGVGEIAELCAGDVGVILGATVAGIEPVGALWTGSRWAWRVQSGIMFGPAEALAAWGPR